MRKIFTLSLIVIIFSSCSDEFNQSMDVFFCTTTPSRSERYLFVDKENIGILPYAEVTPGCEDLPSKKQAIYSNIRSGKHTIEVKDSLGKILYSSKLKIRKRFTSTNISASTKGTRWSTKIKSRDGCIVVEIIH
jgi:hypothetical protein